MKTYLLTSYPRLHTQKLESHKQFFLLFIHISTINIVPDKKNGKMFPLPLPNHLSYFEGLQFCMSSNMVKIH